MVRNRPNTTNMLSKWQNCSLKGLKLQNIHKQTSGLMTQEERVNQLIGLIW